MAKRKRRITRAMQKRAFQAFARWIAVDDHRLRAFCKALRPKRRVSSTRSIKKPTT